MAELAPKEDLCDLLIVATKAEAEHTATQVQTAAQYARNGIPEWRKCRRVISHPIVSEGLQVLSACCCLYWSPFGHTCCSKDPQIYDADY